MKQRRSVLSGVRLSLPRAKGTKERSGWPLLALLALLSCGQGSKPKDDASAEHTGTTALPVPTSQSSASPTASASAQNTASAKAAEPPCPDGMVYVPEGTFRMGSPEGDKESEPDERPVREVHLAAYCIGRTEVTVAEYNLCVAEPKNGVACSPASKTVVSRTLSASDVLFWSKFCNAGAEGKDKHPVNCIDHRQATTYCRWAGGRLPTEAEWERAARGTDGRVYPWGNSPPAAELLNACGAECAKNSKALGRGDKKSMFEGDDGAEGTAIAGSYPKGAAPSGALDMAGNVWEWTADGYAPYDPSKTDNPMHEAGPERVVRGGHWLNVSKGSPRAANREHRDETKRLEDVGLRCAASPGASQ